MQCERGAASFLCPFISEWRKKNKELQPRTQTKNEERKKEFEAKERRRGLGFIQSRPCPFSAGFVSFIFFQ
jgi:hypothetical protein